MFKQSKHHLFIDCPQIKRLKKCSLTKNIIEDAIIKRKERKRENTQNTISKLEECLCNYLKEVVTYRMKLEFLFQAQLLV